jgi:hypothetical protein
VARLRQTALALALSAAVAVSMTPSAGAIGVNRLDSENITTNELAALGWYALSYRVAFWENMTDAERDSLVWRAHVAGVPLLPILSVRYDGVAHEPRGAAWDEWALYVDKVVRRYPTVHSWEVWNEPNAVKFGGAFAVHRWRRFLARTARVIHHARARARVVAGGVSVTQPGWRRYLRVSGADAVGVHPYAPTAAEALRLVREARRIARKPTWVTELDWTGGGERYKATELRRFVRGFHGPTWWYHLQDSKSAPRSYGDDGLFTSRWQPKPIWSALLRGRAPR